VDFGLAKQVSEADLSADQASTVTALTRAGTPMGTLAYMSPEQVQGRAADHRSDLFSFGVVMYELLAGTHPFLRSTGLDTANAIVRDSPAPVPRFRGDVPRSVLAILEKLLAKKPEERSEQARQVTTSLRAAVDETFGRESASARSALVGLRRTLRRPAYLVPLALALVAAAYFSTQWVRSYEKAKWAREEAIPQIRNLVQELRMTLDFSKSDEAFALAREAEKYMPDDPELKELWPRFSAEMAITTEPPGARVWRKPYRSAAEDWREVGITPMEKVRIPIAGHRWKLEKEGFETIQAFSVVFAKLHRSLDATGSIPEGMVRVAVDSTSFLDCLTYETGKEASAGGRTGTLDFYIDKYEVTNVEYKEFVEAGGYQNRSYWNEDFIKEGRKLTWDEALREFVDSTGRPGPSTWEAGDYPQGQSEYPVSGVSWYEAAAYARFVGKELPTSTHWYQASSLNTVVDGLGRPLMSYIAGLANFGGSGPIQVGASGGMDAFGTYDMAGNVREWCWTETEEGRRIRGGAWNDFPYMYSNITQAPPFDRSSKNGFRCVRYIDRSAIPDAAFAKTIDAPPRDISKETPVPDTIFKIYRDQFSFSVFDLNERIEATDSTSAGFIREKVSYDAAYPNGRVTAYLFLPKKASPPYQAIVYWPGNPPEVYTGRSDSLVGDAGFDFILKSGRAVVYPVYFGTYERNSIGSNDEMCHPTAEYRDVYTELLVKMGRDFKRTIDYLESRKDIDPTRLGYFGVSWGGRMGLVMTAIDDRLKASVLYLGGMCFTDARPEADEFNYVRHVRVPTLMLNGRYDLCFPLQTTVLPVYDRLGTPPEDKRSVVYDTDHFAPRREVIKETLAWYDRHLGLVDSKRTD
jgi:formylglycine-generating enzyme required for sulfatase activity/dienelactone hydrolase